ncbi:hypothetical protein CBR_g19571 [Chara braunii]|uniref:Phosphotransferase n=1 Tax=Chara braunii TaxID=69332 RepID=A0A388KYG4_CHABU|nr:hypothetical protein CBR_g19571 [Chara braunii]|eukprot:GBG75058.1 hypothetical protein CBR_g19571 [Chara braunii]
MGREVAAVVTLVACASCAIAVIAIRHRLKRLARMTKAEEMVEAFREQCALPEPSLRKIAECLWNEMGVALRTEDSTLKMLPSFVDLLPTGKEKGYYYALDLGGTNFRVIRVLFGGEDGGVLDWKSAEAVIPQELMTGTREALFDFIADAVAKFVEKEDGGVKHNDGKLLDLGFTFSFPVNQIAIDRGTLVNWTKGFKVPNMEGQEVVGYLNQAFKARGLNMRVTALVVNTEWGNYASHYLPYTFADRELDKESLNKGEQIFEKMISGMYLGDIVRRFLVRLAEETELFGNEALARLRKPFSLSTPIMSRMEMDHSDGLDVVGCTLEDVYGIRQTTLNTRKLVQDVCSIVTERAARLAAAGVYGVLERIRRGNNNDKPPPLTQKMAVAVDGGVYEHFGSFRTQLKDTLAELLEDDADYVDLVLAKDGSGLGAALLAATYSSSG